MRLLSCAAALFWLLVPSAAWAERITITAASATYWTATDELEIRVWFDSPLVVPPDFVQFGGGISGEGRAGEGFYFRSDGRIGRDTMEPFYMAHIEYDTQGRIVEHLATGLPSVIIDGRTLTATMPFEMTGLDIPQFDFAASVIRDSKSHVLDGSSSVDRRIVYTPEPSSVALASFGGAVFFAHLRLPRLRQRRGERH